MMTIGVGVVVIISLVAAKPSRRGMWMSMVTTSGRSCSVRSTAFSPSSASPTTSSSGSVRKISTRRARAVAESSTTRTRIMRFNSQELRDCLQKVLLIEGTLAQKCVGPNLDAAGLIRFGLAGRDQHDGQVAEALRAADRLGQGEAVHP